MMRRLLRCLACLFAASILAPAHAQGDPYPNRTIRIVVGFSPGGFTDVLGRIIAQKLHERLGQPVIVENKPGATGVIAADLIAKSKPTATTC